MNTEGVNRRVGGDYGGCWGIIARGNHLPITNQAGLTLHPMIQNDAALTEN